MCVIGFVIKEKIRPQTFSTFYRDYMYYYGQFKDIFHYRRNIAGPTLLQFGDAIDISEKNRGRTPCYTSAFTEIAIQ